MSTRRNFSAEFKAKVALEALVGDKTLAELAAKHDVHPNMITQWKRQAKESLPAAFGKKASRGSTDRAAEVNQLHAKIDQLAVENDFYTQLGTWITRMGPLEDHLSAYRIFEVVSLVPQCVHRVGYGRLQPRWLPGV